MRFLFLLLSLFTLALYGQGRRDTMALRVMTYNVENLFDVRHDTLCDDYEFLPEGLRRWTYRKYRKKLDDVARVIVAVGKWEPPVLVALCEVENDSVLRDLTRYSLLREAGYRYVMTCSNDRRGIDVALLYRRDLFRLLTWQSHPVPAPRKDLPPTRDLLHVSGRLLSGDTLDVFVAHFPSRSQGRRESEPYRLAAARCLKTLADSLCVLRQRPQLLIMGDFNDYPEDASLRRVLQAEAVPMDSTSLHPHRLYHLLAHRCAAERDFGSYKYQGRWGLLDHILVSGSLLLPDAPLRTDASRADVFRSSFLLVEDEKYGGRRPCRTYYGMKYRGGYSDHLPVWAEFLLSY